MYATIAAFNWATLIALRSARVRGRKPCFVAASAPVQEKLEREDEEEEGYVMYWTQTDSGGGDKEM